MRWWKTSQNTKGRQVGGPSALSFKSIEHAQDGLVIKLP
jgi:hypothetical protein